MTDLKDYDSIMFLIDDYSDVSISSIHELIKDEDYGCNFASTGIVNIENESPMYNMQIHNDTVEQFIGKKNANKALIAVIPITILKDITKSKINMTTIVEHFLAHCY